MVKELCNCDQSLGLETKLLSINNFLFEKIEGLELELRTSHISLERSVVLREVIIRTMEIMKELQRVVSI